MFLWHLFNVHLPSGQAILLIGFQPWSTNYGVTFFSRDAQLATSLLGFKNFSLSTDQDKQTSIFFGTDSKRVDIGNGA